VEGHLGMKLGCELSRLTHGPGGAAQTGPSQSDQTAGHDDADLSDQVGDCKWICEA
jgi:hypothetical protein